MSSVPVMKNILILLCCLGFSGCHQPGYLLSNDVSREIGFKKEVYEDVKTNRVNCKKNYVDPTDMLNYDRSTKKMMPSDSKYCLNSGLHNSCENCASHMRRFVNLFLRATGFKDYALGNFRSKSVRLDLVFKREDLEVLQLFSDTGTVDLSVINTALTNILSAKDNDIIMDNYEEYKDGYFNTVLKPFIIDLFRLPIDFPQYCIGFTVFCVFAITMWQVLFSNSPRTAVVSLMILILGSGFLWNWVKLYKLADAKRRSARFLKNKDGAIPIYCEPEKMSWFQYIYYFYSYEKECEDYFVREIMDPIVEVTPTIVLVETISTMILYPAEKLGSAVGYFVSGLIAAVPWPYRIWVVPIILIFVAMFIIIVSIICVGGKITLRIPFSSFEIGSCPTLFTPQRQFIEDIPASRVPISNESNKQIRGGKKLSVRSRSDQSPVSDDHSGESGYKVSTSNVAGSSQVHVHVHLPKYSMDGGGDNNIKTLKYIPESNSSGALSLENDSGLVVDNKIENNCSRSNVENKIKDSGDSDASENSEFEQIDKCDLNSNENSDKSTK